MPATRPPIRAEASIKLIYEVPRLRTGPILLDNRCPLFISINKARLPHSRNNEQNAAIKLTSGLTGIANATIKDTTAMIHHGKNKPAAKLRRAIKIIREKTFMNL
jgi:hypothetical protein